MSILDILTDIAISAIKKEKPPIGLLGAIDYGRQKNDGSHDHRFNTGSDRTPNQKESDRKRRK